MPQHEVVPITLRYGDIMRDVTLHITIKDAGTYKLRMWLAMRLIRLATLVLGCELQYDGITKEATRND